MNSDPDRHEDQVNMDERAQSETYVPISRWERFVDRYLSNIAYRIRWWWLSDRAPF